jgi:hypothetical protein
MEITLFAPEWDREVEMLAVPRVGDTLVLDDKQWLVEDVEWSLDGGPTANLAIVPKPLGGKAPQQAAREAVRAKIGDLLPGQTGLDMADGIADAAVSAYLAAKGGQ